MTTSTQDLAESDKQPTFLTSDEDRNKALLKAAEEANFVKDISAEVINTAVTFIFLVILYLLYEQGFLSGFGILGLVILLVVAVVLVLRMMRNVRGIISVLTYKRVASQAGIPYVRTPHKCPLLQQVPFRFICAPRPLTDFPNDLLFRCHVETEWLSCQKEIAPELIEYLEQNENPIVRTRAAWGLGVIASKEATPALIKALDDENANVRFISIWSLGDIGDERAVDPLVGWLSSEEPRMSIQASKSLISIGKDACPKLIEEGQANLDNAELVCLIIDALGKIGCEEALLFLKERVNDEDDLIQLQAAYSLGDTRHQDAVAPLLQLLDSDDSFLHEAALDSLSKLGHLTLLGLIEFIDSGGDQQIALDIIFRMEEDLVKELEKLKELGKDAEITKLEQLLNLAAPESGTDD
jgi:hypothetical protein